LVVASSVVATKTLEGEIERLTGGLTVTEERWSSPRAGSKEVSVREYRVLFQVDGNVAVIYRDLHRKDAY